MEHVHNSRFMQIIALLRVYCVYVPDVAVYRRIELGPILYAPPRENEIGRPESQTCTATLRSRHW